MNYIVLDLEWNQSYRGKEYSIEEMPFEIIQIPHGSDRAGKRQRHSQNDMEHNGSTCSLHPLFAVFDQIDKQPDTSQHHERKELFTGYKHRIEDLRGPEGADYKSNQSRGSSSQSSGNAIRKQNGPQREQQAKILPRDHTGTGQPENQGRALCGRKEGFRHGCEGKLRRENQPQAQQEAPCHRRGGGPGPGMCQPYQEDY